MSNVIVLHNELTLLHHSLELIGHKLIEAHESPDRVRRILQAIKQMDGINLIKVDSSTEGGNGEPEIPSNIHTAEYIEHLRTIFKRFLDAGVVDKDGCVLPECFPHYRLLKPPGSQADAADDPKRDMVPLALPKDPFAHLGYYSFDLSAGMSLDTFTSAIASVQMARRAIDMVLESQARRTIQPIFVLTRPPGHHACEALAGGYCYINNVAVTAEYLLSKLGAIDTTLPSTTSRVAILDLDFHHGNGTQSIFYERREPAYVSIHGEGEYPYYTGSAQECGRGDGEGFNRNFPLLARPHSTRDDYLRLLEAACQVIQEEWKSTYLLVSMGFDTFRKDILGGFELDVNDYRTIGRRVRHVGLPVVTLLEGGYSEELGELVAAFLDGLRLD
ncbi:Arginase/deacetylase [Serendipita vermifera]|nr:Arginase/deacetylase [Serendipita vermifera]